MRCSNFTLEPSFPLHQKHSLLTMGSISIRKFIRWLPDEASEPTSTIVVTSPERRFVDIRILHQAADTGQAKETEPLPLDRLDWAIAGTSSSWMRDDGQGGQVNRGQWRHWIDSRTTKPEDATDEGDNYPQPDGTTLEKGAMVNPDTGLETDYEEVWIDEEPKPVGNSSTVRFIVMQVEQPELRGSVVRVGHRCQAFLRKRDMIVAERWEWTGEGENGWERTAAIGNRSVALLSEDILTEDCKLQVGETLSVAGLPWKVIEKSEKSA